MQTLLAGLPLLMLPLHLEQALTARNAVRLGAGLGIESADEKTDFLAPIKELVTNPSYTARARDFAAKYSTIDRETVLNSIVQRCEVLLATKVNYRNAPQT